MQTMVRTEVGIDDRSYYLAQGQDVEALKRRIEEAARSGPVFVDFTVVGNRSVSVLVSSASRIVFTIETVQYDPRDNGDEEAPYGGLFDGL
ncbi:hypothetical protein GCM10010921_01970 [Microbacterium album]|uniref:Uncharacterized protein n=2 Tax=Microbacterium album TaxID=2053191 RepID=A0A917IDF2_9MICO|nr:hypothetical protein GCM10010921_01970 [Microbacterium album]